jgi:hypothetical protein
MICEQCKAEGQTSTITVGGGCTTAMYHPPYYDEAGVRAGITGRYPGCAWPEPAST